MKIMNMIWIKIFNYIITILIILLLLLFYSTLAFLCLFLLQFIIENLGFVQYLFEGIVNCIFVIIFLISIIIHFYMMDKYNTLYYFVNSIYLKICKSFNLLYLYYILFVKFIIILLQCILIFFMLISSLLYNTIRMAVGKIVITSYYKNIIKPFLLIILKIIYIFIISIIFYIYVLYILFLIDFIGLEEIEILLLELIFLSITIILIIYNMYQIYLILKKLWN
jgi:hypothetical protein